MTAPSLSIGSCTAPFRFVRSVHRIKGPTLCAVQRALAIVVLLSGIADAQDFQATDLLGVRSATDLIPIACVHQQLDTRQIAKGQVFCDVCIRALERFKADQASGAPTRKMELCGACPRPTHFESVATRRQLHMADVASVGDVAESMVWLANCRRWDDNATATALLHVEFLAHVSTPILQPMLAMAVRRLEAIDRPAPAVARLVVMFAERNPAFLGERESFVLNGLREMSANATWAVLDDFGRAGPPAWRAAPHLLEHLRTQAAHDSAAPSEAHYVLAAMQLLLDEDRPFRDLQRPGRVPSPASRDEAPRRLPWEQGAATATAPGASGSGSQNDSALKSDFAAARRAGDVVGQMRLSVRASHQMLKNNLARRPNLLDSPGQVRRMLSSPLLALCPEVRPLLTQAQFQQLRDQANQQVLPPTLGQAQQTAALRLRERITACCEAYLRGDPQAGDRLATALWRWVTDDAVELTEPSANTVDAAAPSAARTKVDRTINWRSFDRALALPTCLAEYVDGMKQSWGGRVDATFLKPYLTLEVGRLESLAPRCRESIGSWGNFMVLREMARINVQQSLDDAARRPPEAMPSQSQLRDLAARLELFSRVLTTNAARTTNGLGKQLGKTVPVDLLGSDLDAASYLAVLDTEVQTAAAAVGDGTATERATAEQHYRRLREVRCRVAWGDFEIAQAELDRIWLELLRP